MGREVVDPTTLWETYKIYYDQLFSNYEKVTLDIIGSTDSLWINSIYQTVANTKKKNSSNGKKGIEKKQNDSIPWIQSESEILPKIIVYPTDTLLEGELTSPIKTPFGYFICRVAKVEKIRSVSFQEARNQCIYLATREKYLRKDSIIDEKAYNYYKKHWTQYTSPDTMIIQVWLLPIKKTYTHCTKNKIDSTKNYIQDTLSFRSIIISALSLPEEVRLKLEKQYFNAKNKSDFLGPIKDRYGIWCFKIKKIKPGGLQTPFELVKQEIIDTLVKPYLEISYDTSNAGIKKLEFETALAKEYVINTGDEIENLKNEEIKVLIDKGEINTSKLEPGLSDEEKFENVREVIREQNYKKRKKMIREWSASIKIDEETLFQ